MIKVILACCHYQNSPGTYYYVNRALRKLLGNDAVVTIGNANDIDTREVNPYPILMDKINAGELDLDPKAILLEVESGGFDLGWTPPPEFPFKKAYWAIDSHISLIHHQPKSRFYDHVFLAQNAYVKQVQEYNKNTAWLPLACDEELHDGNRFPDQPMIPCDITFVGHFYPAVHQRRMGLVHYLQSSGVQVGIFSDLWLDKVTEVYRKSRMVLNCALRGDINMRFFEALASGRCMVTDQLPPESGIKELLGGEQVCLFYNSPEEARMMIKNPPKDPDAIGMVGREWVLAGHTYQHRMKKVLEVVGG